jgi:DNA polymerase-3 subunit alpha
VVSEPKETLKAALMTMNNGIEMNNELIQYLSDKPEIDIQVSVI